MAAKLSFRQCDRDIADCLIISESTVKELKIGMYGSKLAGLAKQLYWF